ncbi:MAG: hypothetical protein ACO2ZK_12285, partial [Gemmobacter sp.]
RSCPCRRLRSRRKRSARRAARARARGLEVVMNRCPKIEMQRLCGELRMGGFATGVVSSRL